MTSTAFIIFIGICYIVTLFVFGSRIIALEDHIYLLEKTILMVSKEIRKAGHPDEQSGE